MITGIYLLRFKDNSIYVGQSKDINRRFTTHCNKLAKGTHVNTKLSSTYTKYGMPSLEVLLECSEDDLDANEIAAIEVYNSINAGLNIAPAAGAFPILNGESNGVSKYSDEEILKAAIYLANNIVQPLKVSASILDMHYSTIKNIANGTSHRWLQDRIPELYHKLISAKGTRTINSLASKGIEKYISSPDGVVYSINNIAEFARQHNLNAGALGEVLRANTRQHKGWTLPLNNP